MSESDPQTITPLASALPRGMSWMPEEGTETARLVESMRRVTAAEKATLVREAVTVLGSGRSPVAAGPSRTGLVVGFVQSGKTASFTTVTALARDNQFRLIVVITGISTNLLGQSNDRLVTDFDIVDRDDRTWRVIQNPSLTNAQASTRVAPEELQAVLDLWQRPNAPRSHRQTLLVTVMKNHAHLRNLTTLLRELRLTNVPTLVIDDEADQAGLNTGVANNTQSPTYRRILEFRRALPEHTYLQYTATPQAPLLISLADSLSPDFVRVLTPGNEYIGGAEFFEDRQELVRAIPTADIISANNAPTSPPASFLEALRSFFLGVAAGLIQDDGRGNRSMLVHPSQGTLQHDVYYQWTLYVRQTWLATLQDTGSSADRDELLAQFQRTYEDLAETVGSDIPSFDAIVDQLPNALSVTKEARVNATGGRTPKVEWRDCYGHILIGGQAMDRGFTVEGLTVTYMPRGAGTGIADTIQQRARFLGYKRRYVGYCRVYLEADVREKFRGLVKHERAMRRELEEHAATGAPLSEWRRKFFLDPRLKPTRDSVIGLGNMTRSNFAREPFKPNTLFQPDSASIVQNRALFAAFESTITLSVPGDGDRTNLQASGVPLVSVYNDLVVPYLPVDPADSVRMTALRMQLLQVLEADSAATCTIYSMGRAREASFLRKRPVDPDTGALATQTGLFQGRNAAGYPGDENLPTVSPDKIQVQLHHLSLHEATLDGPQLAADVCVLVCKLDPSSVPDVVIQGA